MMVMASPGGLQHPADTQEFLQLRARLQWGRDKMASIFGSDPSRIKQWLRGGIDVDPRRLAFMREVAAFLDTAEQAHFDTLDLPGSDMSGEEFATALYALGWNPRDWGEGRVLTPPYFAELTGIPGVQVRLMAFGRMPVTQGLCDGLRPLVAQLPPKRIESARIKAQQLLHHQVDYDPPAVLTEA